MLRERDRYYVKAVAVGVKKREGSKGHFKERSNTFFPEGHRVFVLYKIDAGVKIRVEKNRDNGDCRHCLLTNCKAVAT